MNHFATSEFWYCYRCLPDEVRELADKNFALLRQDPHHPSLRLKKVGSFWSAVGLEEETQHLQLWPAPPAMPLA